MDMNDSQPVFVYAQFASKFRKYERRVHLESKTQ